MSRAAALFYILGLLLHVKDGIMNSKHPSNDHPQAYRCTLILRPTDTLRFYYATPDGIPVSLKHSARLLRFINVYFSCLERTCSEMGALGWAQAPGITNSVQDLAAKPPKNPQLSGVHRLGHATTNR